MPVSFDTSPIEVVFPDRVRRDEEVAPPRGWNAVCGRLA